MGGIPFPPERCNHQFVLERDGRPTCYCGENEIKEPRYQITSFRMPLFVFRDGELIDVIPRDPQFRTVDA